MKVGVKVFCFCTTLFMGISGFAHAADNYGDYQHLRNAAEQGDVKAQIELGFAYFKGQAVSQDNTEALKWFRSAAEQGDAYAQYILGYMLLARKYSDSYEYIYEDEDQAEGVKWLRRAAEQGYVKAQTTLGKAYPSLLIKEHEAMKWLFRAAGEGDVEAQMYLAYMYSLMHDADEVTYWIRRAAEQGNAEAQSLLGTLYANGHGVAKDHTEAEKWFHRVFEGSDTQAQYRLAYAYYVGRDGMPVNDTVAAKWFHRAAEQGHEHSQLKLSEMYTQGQGVPQNSAEAKKWQQRYQETKIAKCFKAPLETYDRDLQKELREESRVPAEFHNDFKLAYGKRLMVAARAHFNCAGLDFNQAVEKIITRGDAFVADKKPRDVVIETLKSALFLLDVEGGAAVAVKERYLSQAVVQKYLDGKKKRHRKPR